MISIRNLTQSLRGMPAYGRRLAEALERIESEINRLSSTQAAAALTGSAAASGSVDPVYGLTVTYRHLPPNANDDKYVEVTVEYNAPAGWDAGYGVSVYYSYPDTSGQSRSNLSGFSLSGTSGLGGVFVPDYYGRFAYVVGETGKQKITFRIIANKDTKSLRVWLASFSPSADADFDISATPTATVSIDPYPFGAIGQEYADLVTDFSVTTGEKLVSGVKKVTLECSFTKPADRRWSGVRIFTQLVGEEPVPLPGSFSGTTYHEIDMPGSIVDMRVYGSSVSDPAGTPDPDDDGVNTVVYGFTPSQVVTIGTADGVVDLSKALTGTFNGVEFKLENGQFLVNGLDLRKFINTTVASHLGETSGVFGVLPSGITASLVAASAIENPHIQRLGVNKLAVVDADVVNLSANKLNAGSIAATIAYLGQINATQINAGTLNVGVVYSGTINTSQVNAGNFNGHTLTLNLNGVTTTVNNSVYVDGIFGTSYAGLKVSNNSSNRQTVILDGYVGAWGSSSAGYAIVYASSGGNAIFSNASNVPTVSIAGGTGFVSTSGFMSAAAYQVGGDIVVSARQPTVTTVAYNSLGAAASFTTGLDSTIFNLCIAVNTIISRLQTHGLIS